MASGSKPMKQYEAAVFDKLDAVPLSLVGQTLKPLDLLVKQRSEETGKGFVVRKVGNLYNDENLRVDSPLRIETAGDADDREEAEQKWQLFTNDQQGQRPTVLTRQVDDAKTTDLVKEGNSSGGFFGALLRLFNLETTHCTSWRYEVSGIRCITIDAGKFMDRFTGREPDIRIDVQRILSRDSDFMRNKDGELEVWVVTDLFWCDKLIFQAKDGNGREADIQVNGEAVAAAMGFPMPIAGLKAGYKWVQCQTSLEVQSTDDSNPIWMAFKAIRLAVMISW